MEDQKQVARKGVQFVIQQQINQMGEITASVLVELARPKNSPAHAGFEWDNGKAAEEYRLIQARRWIKLIEVQQAADADQEPVMVSLVHVPSAERGEKEGTYKPLPMLVKAPDEYQRALAEAKQQLAAAQRAVDSLVELTNRAAGADKIALIAQIARGMELMREALQKM